MKRGFFQIHFLTAIVMMIVAGILIPALIWGYNHALRDERSHPTIALLIVAAFVLGTTIFAGVVTEAQLRHRERQR